MTESAASSPYLGLDVGTRRIGVAKSDARGRMAMPSETVDASRRGEAAERIAQIIDQSGAHTVVVGWPLNLDGTAGRAVRRTEKFIARLEEALAKCGREPAIVEWDERLTTSAAENFLIGADVSRKRRKQVVDQIAAAHILQGYLDSLD